MKTTQELLSGYFDGEQMPCGLVMPTVIVKRCDSDPTYTVGTLISQNKGHLVTLINFRAKDCGPEATEIRKDWREQWLLYHDTYCGCREEKLLDQRNPA